MDDFLDEMDEELIKEFFAEADAQVESLERNILAIEQNPSDHASIDEIFRAAHTLKGGSATVGMTELAGFTHLVEDLLDEIRSNNIIISEQTIDILLDSIDLIKSMLDSRREGSIFDGDVSTTERRLKEALGAAGQHEDIGPSLAEKEKSAHPSQDEGSEISIHLAEFSQEDLLEAKELIEEGEKVYQIAALFDLSDPMAGVGGIQVFTKLQEVGKVLSVLPDFEKVYEGEWGSEGVHYLVASREDSDRLDQLITRLGITTTLKIEERALPLDEAPLKFEQTLESSVDQAVSQKKRSSQDEKNMVSSPPASASTQETQGPKEARKSSTTQREDTPQKQVETKEEGGGTLLRVESRRIDNLLNLVSEAVINKAAFAQLSAFLQQKTASLQDLNRNFVEEINSFFSEIPAYMERYHDSPEDLEMELRNDFKHLPRVFEQFFRDFKGFTGAFRGAVTHLVRNTGDLHEATLKIRMVPIKQAFSRFPRLVRDLSRELGKKVRLVLEGEETEMDKSVREDLMDPLMHCVRNSLDHGIEVPKERLAVGKPPEGTIVLSASNEGNMILIEVKDDGKGIDVAKIQKKALERGLIHPDKHLSDVEAFEIIFDSGFSTAHHVTNISGRGVGLDVVKKQIEKLKGTLSVYSEEGKGSTFSIRLPLTLAIIQGLLVRVGEEKYVIPIGSVVESQPFSQEKIHFIDNQEIIHVRGEVIGLVRLGRLFNIDLPRTEEEKQSVVVISERGSKMGLVVDQLLGENDVVIKPLTDRYTNSPGISGATILGDGTVALITDVSELMKLTVWGGHSWKRQPEKSAVS